MATFPGDFGIIFKGTTGTVGTYVDVLGQTRNEMVLVDLTENRMPVDVSSAYVHAGLARRFTLFVDVVADGEVDITLQGHYDLDPSAAWLNLFVFDNDDTTNTSATITLTTGTWHRALQTSNAGTVPEVCLMVNPHSAFSGTVTARLVALP